uniref:Uncharacterized protein n=1 Tax=Anopheles christyi TaxID=43041 RepID=A0A182JTV3_9DIPT
MYNQVFNGSATYGVGYGTEYQQQYYYQQQQQQQQSQKQQQMIAGIMGYYPPEAAAMFYNPYPYVHGQTAQQQFAQQQTHLDYQLTPALYLLNQQAELLQKSLVKGHSKKSSLEANKPQRKQRGPYKRRTNKTLSPTVSPAPEFVTDTAERLSSSDLSGSNNRSAGPIHIDLTCNINSPITSTTIESNCFHHQQLQQEQRKRKSDSFLQFEQQANKHCRTLLSQQKQSIFRDVALMAVSSSTTTSVPSSC